MFCYLICCGKMILKLKRCSFSKILSYADKFCVFLLVLFFPLFICVLIEFFLELLHGICKPERKHVDLVKHEVHDDNVQDALVQSSQDVHENSYEEDEKLPQMDEIKIKESGKKIEGKNLIRKLDKKRFFRFDLI